MEGFKEDGFLPRLINLLDLNVTLSFGIIQLILHAGYLNPSARTFLSDFHF